MKAKELIAELVKLDPETEIASDCHPDREGSPWSDFEPACEVITFRGRLDGHGYALLSKPEEPGQSMVYIGANFRLPGWAHPKWDGKKRPSDQEVLNRLANAAEE